jgi:hypothetical protein
MTVLRRRPHPARSSRILAAGMSVTAFLSMVSTFLWNAQAAAAEQAAAVQPVIDAPEPTPHPTPTIKVIKKVAAKSTTVSKKPTAKKKTTAKKATSKSTTTTTTTTCRTAKGGPCR